MYYIDHFNNSKVELIQNIRIPDPSFHATFMIKDMKKLKMSNPINSSKVEYNEYETYDNKSNESDDEKVIEEKFINVKDVNIVGS